PIKSGPHTAECLAHQSYNKAVALILRAKIPAKLFTWNAVTKPKRSSPTPVSKAPFLDARPLGMARSGRSVASISASNRSLNTTPPPYNPKVDSKSQPSPAGSAESDHPDTAITPPTAAKPAKISAKAVRILAGRINSP